MEIQYYQISQETKSFLGTFNPDLPGDSFDDFLNLYLYGRNEFISGGEGFAPTKTINKLITLSELKRMEELSEDSLEDMFYQCGFDIIIDTDCWKPPSHTFKGCLAYMIDKLEQSIKDDLGNRSVNN